MKKNIKFGISSLFVAMLILSSVFVSTVSAETLNEEIISEMVTAEEPELVLEPLPEPIIDSASTTEINPYWYLLEADKEQQKILFKYIDNCYVSDEEKKEMKKAMKDIWKRYPDQITEQDNLMLEKVATSSAEYLNDKYGNNDVGIEWTATPTKI